MDNEGVSINLINLGDVCVKAPQTQSLFDVETLEERFKTESHLGGLKDWGVEFAIQHSVRRSLPYGKWTCKDGREVIFNREYQPILQTKDGVASHADRGEWVRNIVKTEMYYDDSCSPMDLLSERKTNMTSYERKRCRKSLAICLQVLRDYSPADTGSVNRQWSPSKL